MFALRLLVVPLLCLSIVLTLGACSGSSPEAAREDSTLAGGGGVVRDLLPEPRPKPMAVMNDIYRTLIVQAVAAKKTATGGVPLEVLEQWLFKAIVDNEGIPRTQIATLLKDTVSTQASACGGASCARIFGFTSRDVERILDYLYGQVRIDARLATKDMAATRNLLIASLQSHRSRMTVLYWDNKNLGFGHVAVEVYGPSPVRGEPDYYLSFAMGNNLAKDMIKHGKDPQRIELPVRSAETFYAFRDWFKDSVYSRPMDLDYYEKYCTVSDNCAHAVLTALHQFGYDIKISEGRPALLPSQIKDAAEKMAREP